PRPLALASPRSGAPRVLPSFPTRRSSDLLLVPLPVILPLFAAGVKLALGGRRPKLQQAVSLITLTVVLIVGALLMVGSQRYGPQDRKSTRLNSSHVSISYAVFCLKKKT